jgi:hypothetical protein
MDDLLISNEGFSLRPMKHIPHIFVATLIVLGLSACEDRMDCLCTQEYRSVMVHIQQQNGRPVDSLETWTRDKLTSKVIRADTTLSAITHPTGDYLILSDGERNFFGPSPKMVVFQAQNSKWSVESAYEFYTDDCGCHIRKSSGADTIIVH